MLIVVHWWAVIICSIGVAVVLILTIVRVRWRGTVIPLAICPRAVIVALGWRISSLLTGPPATTASAAVMESILTSVGSSASSASPYRGSIRMVSIHVVRSYILAFLSLLKIQKKDDVFRLDFLARNDQLQRMLKIPQRISLFALLNRRLRGPAPVRQAQFSFGFGDGG